MQGELMIEYTILRNVEQTIIFFFVWREMNGESGWYENGIKELASVVKRHEKSVRKAIESLQEMNLITTQKNNNTIWVKHTLSDDELYSRMAFISYVFYQPQSIQELEEDLNQEIIRLEEEIILSNEEIERKEEQIRIRDFVIQHVNQEDIEIFVDRILADRTYANASMTFEELIKDKLEIFREEMFSKYGGTEDDGEIILYN